MGWPRIETYLDLERLHNRGERATASWERFNVPPQEPFFCFLNCEVCQRPLAGMRWDTEVFVDGEELQYDICQDCIEILTMGEINELDYLSLK